MDFSLHSFEDVCAPSNTETAKRGQVHPSSEGCMLSRRGRSDHGLLYHKALGRRVHTGNVAGGEGCCFAPRGREEDSYGGLGEEVALRGWRGLEFVDGTEDPYCVPHSVFKVLHTD